MEANQVNEEKKFKSGTTTLGIAGKNLVVLAADKQATMGNLKASKEAKKIHKLDDKIGITIAGSVGDAQSIIRIMRSELKLYKLRAKELSVKGTANLLSNILQSNKMLPFLNQFILAGNVNGSGKIYDLDPGGGMIENTKFTSTGSGSPTAYGVLEDAFSEDMERDEVIELGIRSVVAASERDVNSGEGIDVATITQEEGFNRLDPEEVEEKL